MLSLAPATSGTPSRPAFSLPVRILGPWRSWRSATARRWWRDAVRILAMTSAWSACVPCEKFSRATSIPTVRSFSSVSLSWQAGPMVATILARRTVAPSGVQSRAPAYQSPRCGDGGGSLPGPSDPAAVKLAVSRAPAAAELLLDADVAPAGALDRLGHPAEGREAVLGPRRLAVVAPDDGVAVGRLRVGAVSIGVLRHVHARHVREEEVGIVRADIRPLDARRPEV